MVAVSEGPVVPGPGAAQVSPALKAAFSQAISRVYLFNIFLVAGGLLMTLFVPELPLRKSNDSAPPVPAE
ncbi:hypothetical protein MUN84_02405 [Hymenobacter sp. 5516J-16]|uniref:hypothetical protein n=1 Tax=Hymenobacter sp. 5516J-16 TaxID=2932253 RepID=UPI001FD62815|nr:hypothetical protein [Hymenobacter sp. 5516J-16]UOQ77572.1 hypothetical protein MUN84_02405 [Hymenobacter sp. 5516J-16]